MELKELLKRRLKISLGAVQGDAEVSDSLKSTLSVIVESINLQSNTIELAESQLSSKISDRQFRSGLALRLSIKDFTDYFQKIERIVEKMENYWNCSEAKTAEIIDSKFQKISRSFEEIMKQKADQLHQNQRMDAMRRAEISELKRDIVGIQDQLQENMQQTKLTHDDLKKQLQSQITKLINNLQNKPSNNLPNEKLKTVLSEMKDIQLFFNQTHQQIQSLMKSAVCNNNSSTDFKQKIATNIDNISNLQGALKRLQNKVDFADARLEIVKKIQPMRFMWEWMPATSKVKWQTLHAEFDHSSDKIILKNSLTISNEGFYSIILGYLGDTGLCGTIKLLIDDTIFCEIHMDQQIQTKGLCRTTMLYAYLIQGNSLRLSVGSQSSVVGLLQVALF